MKLKIGVMGSATGFLSTRQRSLAYALGRAIAECDCVTITGACPGLPLESAKGAMAGGGLVVGISPALSEWEHVYKYDSPVECHDVLIYTGSGLMGREVVNIRSSDVVVIIGGRSGTLGEFSIAYDEGKLIGVLLGSGGITSEIKTIVRIIRKKQARELFTVMIRTNSSGGSSSVSAGRTSNIRVCTKNCREIRSRSRRADRAMHVE